MSAVVLSDRDTYGRPVKIVSKGDVVFIITIDRVWCYVRPYIFSSSGVYSGEEVRVGVKDIMRYRDAEVLYSYLSRVTGVGDEVHICS